METILLHTHTADLFEAAVEQAALALRSGEVVALPTETVYGLAANVFNPLALERIFALKGRPPGNPLIVHVASFAMARACVREWPAVAQTLADAFWPGPLTIVLPRSASVPSIVTGGGETVGIRWPQHPFVQAVIRRCDFPLAAPSANISGRISPTTAGHVLNSLGGKTPFVVDGGACNIGLESTVVDLSVEPFAVLRPGMISAESLSAVAGVEIEDQAAARTPGAALHSPGQLAKHYAPRAKVELAQWRDEGDLRLFLERRGFEPVATHVWAHTVIPSPHGLGRVTVIPPDAQAFARALYAELHRADELGAKYIVIEALPGSAEWRAVADRLARASA